MWYLVFSTNHCFISIVCLYCLLPGPTTGVLTLDLSQVNTTACLRLERSVSQKHFYIALAQLSSNLMSQRVLTFTRLGLCLATKQMTYCNCYLCTCCFYVWLIAFGFFFKSSSYSELFWRWTVWGCWSTWLMWLSRSWTRCWTSPEPPSSSVTPPLTASVHTRETYLTIFSGNSWVSVCFLSLVKQI